MLVKKFVLYLFSAFVASKGFGQIKFSNSNIGRVTEFVDLNGNSLLKTYDPDIAGSPFLLPDWSPAAITLFQGKTFGPLRVKLNIESNELYFLDSAGREMVAPTGLVRRVDCPNAYSKDSVRYVFKSGYPAIDQQNENYFYQVLAEGKIELLMKRSKYIRTDKNDLSGEVSKEFIESDKIYVYANHTMQAFQNNKDFVFRLLKDKEQAVRQFIETNKTDIKRIPDLIKLFTYYNEQP